MNSISSTTTGAATPISYSSSDASTSSTTTTGSTTTGSTTTGSTGSTTNTGTSGAATTPSLLVETPNDAERLAQQKAAMAAAAAAAHNVKLDDIITLKVNPNVKNSGGSELVV